MSNSDITIACTSCGRFKLLKRTITSLEKNVDITWCKKIMTEDSKDAKHIEKMKKAQKDGFLKWWEIIFTWWSNKKNPYQSHYCALKKLYDKIDTEFTFHLEDDWLFYRKYKNLLQESINILETDKKVWIVCYRNNFYKDVYNLFISKRKIKNQVFLENLYNIDWKKYLQYLPYWKDSEHFTLNPWLRRTTEVKSIMFNHEEQVDEYKIWIRYKSLWLITICIPICNHIGWWFSSTAFFKDWFLKSLLRAIKNALMHYYKTIFK